MIRRSTLPWVAPGEPLPPPGLALRDPDGLLAAGSDLSADRLIEAYRQGIYPWYSAGQPVLWWSPDPRMVLHLDEFSPSRSLTKTLRRMRRERTHTISLDRAFAQVMRACAEPRPGQDGTWIDERMIHAYSELHRRGLAHSVETWVGERLVGGLYGVSIGRMFFGESMFARETDASKVALALWVTLLRRLEFSVIDCQRHTGHLASLGAREIPRAVFLSIVQAFTRRPAPNWAAAQVDFADV
jgi:leucyl/phenylalanyl-tRNA--protein transferase